MRFDAEKKRAIIHYLMEKIAAGTQSVGKVVSQEMQISPNTVNTYIKELMDERIIEKKKRGTYILVEHQHDYLLQREKGDLDTDTYAYELCLAPHLRTTSANVREIWSYTFSEMVNNVMDHSEAETLYVSVKQDYLNTKVLLLDDGIGIFEKIKNHFGFSTLDDAICELFKGKLTTDAANHSGEGIFFSSKMMDKFFILSSKKVFTNNKYDNNMIMDVPGFSDGGTCVIMTLSNFTQKRSGDVFDMYSNVDGGFSKTRIPLKNIFDSSPVSRSQAKRVCNRLERFKEVVLDFDGIEWMGQGFAHQIFIIFQREHPDIKLTTEHMNASVEKMYIHVING